MAPLLAIALAGCGASSTPSAPSPSAFKSGFRADKVHFRTLGLDLQQAIGGAKSKSDAQLATELGALSRRAKQQASELSRLDPPAKYKGNLSKLVSAFDAVASDLEHISVAAAKNDAQAATSATRMLIADAAKVKAADDAITAGLALP